MTRDEDERMLHALTLYRRGHTLKSISRATGLTLGALTKRLVRVRDDDIAHDPDAESYWRNLSKLKRFSPHDPDTAPHRHHGTRRFR